MTSDESSVQLPAIRDESYAIRVSHLVDRGLAIATQIEAAPLCASLAFIRFGLVTIPVRLYYDPERPFVQADSAESLLPWYLLDITEFLPNDADVIFSKIDEWGPSAVVRGVQEPSPYNVYWVMPDDVGVRPFALLGEVLGTSKCALAKITGHRVNEPTFEYDWPVLLRFHGNSLGSLVNFAWAFEEMHVPRDVPTPPKGWLRNRGDAGFTDRERAMANLLVSAMERTPGAST